jgi:hypothetical protein
VKIREGQSVEVPTELLEDAAHTEVVSAEVNVEPRAFASRLELGEYLNGLLNPLPIEEIDRNRGLWAWLSLRLFDVVCPRRPDGSRKPGRDYRHIPDFGYRYRHRHLLFGPYELFRRHGTRSVVMLAGPPSSESNLYHEIAGRQELVSNPGVVEATVRLYMDRKTGAPRKGAQGSATVAGGVRRLVHVLQQLDLTFDIHAMSGRSSICCPMSSRFGGSAEPLRYWWVNQNQTHRAEIRGGYLWSPKRKSNDQRNPFCEFMRGVSQGVSCARSPRLREALVRPFALIARHACRYGD